MNSGGKITMRMGLGRLLEHTGLFVGHMARRSAVATLGLCVGSFLVLIPWAESISIMVLLVAKTPTGIVLVRWTRATRGPVAVTWISSLVMTALRAAIPAVKLVGLLITPGCGSSCHSMTYSASIVSANLGS